MASFLEKINYRVQMSLPLSRRTVEDYLKYIEENYYQNCGEKITDIKNELEKYRYIKHTKFNKILHQAGWDCYTRVGITMSTECSVVIDCVFSDVLYLKWNGFDKNVEKTILDKLSKSQHQNLILDVRDNCGGSVNSAIRIANMLLEECEICSLEYRDRIITIHSKKEHIRFKNIFIFINESTMSSAELLYFSLFLNNERVWLIGNKSYKKIVGQNRYISNYCKGKYLLTSSFIWKVHERTVESFCMETSYERRIILLDKDSKKDDYMRKVEEILEGKMTE